MRTITKLDVTRGVAARFQLQYFRDGEWPDAGFGPAMDHEVTHRRIVEAGDDAAAIDAAIGNGSWTSLKCNECGTEVESVVELGEARDYESSTAEICFPCLTSAIAREATASPPSAPRTP